MKDYVESFDRLVGCSEFAIAVQGGAASILQAFCVLNAGHPGKCLVKHPVSGELLEVEHHEPL